MNYEEATADIKLVSSLLCGIGAEEAGGDAVALDGTKYARVYEAQSAYSLGSDEAGMYEMVQNFEVSCMNNGG